MRNCDKCKTELTPVFPDLLRRRNDYPQYEDALVIGLSGGYGMLVDYMIFESPPQFVLCKECGLDFFKENPHFITPEISMDERIENLAK